MYLMKPLSLSVLPYHLAVCRLDHQARLPDWLVELPFWSVTRTAEELSLVLPEENVLEEWKNEKGWRVLMVRGPLDFSLVGILAALTAALAAAGIPIFALSTFDTDYLLVKEQDLFHAIEVLTASGYAVI
jgi:uncharacterized protein